jgi:predicted short-subunit dehydrogenase-like oxidoreductase (DUF2520 family)
VAGHRSRIFLHTCGGAAEDALAALEGAGAATGRLHPLFPFTGGRGEARHLTGVSFAVSGSPRAVALASRLARSLNGRVMRLPAGAEGPYHLSAVLASNLMVALTASAAGLGPAWGQARDAAVEALLPLLRATVKNLEQAGLPEALTGPVVRGEASSVQAHLDYLRRAGLPDLAEIYRLLSLAALDLAVEAGHLDGRQRRGLRQALEPAALKRRQR